jgi:hypothetical protein
MKHFDPLEAVSIYRNTKNQREFVSRCGIHGIDRDDAEWLWEVIDTAVYDQKNENKETES